MMRSSLVVLLALAACTTDEPKRGDAGATDAGAASLAPAAVPAAPADAGAPGAAFADAGAIPVVEEQVDAGHLGDAPAHTTSGGGGAIGAPPPVDVDPITVTIWNRVIAKAKARDVNAGVVQETAERLTGQKVEKVRRTAGTFWLIQFAPTSPPRTKADQAKLIEQLKASGEFAVVEGDQIMTIK